VRFPGNVVQVEAPQLGLYSPPLMMLPLWAESRVDTSTHKRYVNGPPRKVRLDDEKKISDRAGQHQRVRPANLESSLRWLAG
jgi:hypothetical protein